MANPQKQAQPQGRENGGSPQGGVREGLHDLGHKVQEGTAQVGERLHEGYDVARDGLQHGYRRAEGTIARNPTESVLVAFGLGVGVGVALAMLLTSRREDDSWYERYVPNRLRNIHIPDAIARHMPGH